MRYIILVIFLFAAFNVYSQDTASIGKQNINPRALNLREITKMIEYPDSARENDIEGRVVIMLLVDEKGNVISDKGFKQGHPVFYNEIRRCAYKLKFSPAKMNGVITKCYINIPFEFTLKRED